MAKRPVVNFGVEPYTYIETAFYGLPVSCVGHRRKLYVPLIQVADILNRSTATLVHHMSPHCIVGTNLDKFERPARRGKKVYVMNPGRVLLCDLYAVQRMLGGEPFAGIDASEMRDLRGFIEQRLIPRMTPIVPTQPMRMPAEMACASVDMPKPGLLRRLWNALVY